MVRLYPSCDCGSHSRTYPALGVDRACVRWLEVGEASRSGRPPAALSEDLTAGSSKQHQRATSIRYIWAGSHLRDTHLPPGELVGTAHSNLRLVRQFRIAALPVRPRWSSWPNLSRSTTLMPSLAKCYRITPPLRRWLTALTIRSRMSFSFSARAGRINGLAAIFDEPYSSAAE